MAPKNQAMGIPHQIPIDPISSERNHDVGSLTAHNANKVIIIGINVSPAPLSRPFRINMVEKTI